MTVSTPNKTKSNRWKFIIGGILFAVAIIFMVISATKATAQFFLTVNELRDSPKDLTGQNLRVSGAVIGDSIQYDPETGALTFMIAHIPGDEKEIQAMGGLETVLHQSASDPDSARLMVRYAGSAPDMLRDEAQAIVTGTLDAQGIFVAEELLLKCPSKYEEALPGQVE